MEPFAFITAGCLGFCTLMGVMGYVIEPIRTLKWTAFWTAFTISAAILAGVACFVLIGYGLDALADG